MQRDLALEALIVAKFAAVSPVLDERGRRLWAAAESHNIGYVQLSFVASASLTSSSSGRCGSAARPRLVEPDLQTLQSSGAQARPVGPRRLEILAFGGALRKLLELAANIIAEVHCPFLQRSSHAPCPQAGPSRAALTLTASGV